MRPEIRSPTTYTPACSDPSDQQALVVVRLRHAREMTSLRDAGSTEVEPWCDLFEELAPQSVQILRAIHSWTTGTRATTNTAAMPTAWMAMFSCTPASPASPTCRTPI